MHQVSDSLFRFLQLTNGVFVGFFQGDSTKLKRVPSWRKKFKTKDSSSPSPLLSPARVREVQESAADGGYHGPATNSYVAAGPPHYITDQSEAVFNRSPLPHHKGSWEAARWDRPRKCRVKGDDRGIEIDRITGGSRRERLRITKSIPDQASLSLSPCVCVCFSSASWGEWTTTTAIEKKTPQKLVLCTNKN